MAQNLSVEIDVEDINHLGLNVLSVMERKHRSTGDEFFYLGLTSNVPLPILFFGNLMKIKFLVGNIKLQVRELGKAIITNV